MRADSIVVEAFAIQVEAFSLAMQKTNLQNDLLNSNKIITYLATASVSPFDSRRRLYNNDKCELTDITRTSLTMSTTRPTSAKHMCKSKQLVCNILTGLVVAAAVISRGMEFKISLISGVLTCMQRC